MNPRHCPSHQADKPATRCQNCELALAQYEHKRERIATACYAAMIGSPELSHASKYAGFMASEAIIYADALIEALDNG